MKKLLIVICMILLIAILAIIFFLMADKPAYNQNRFVSDGNLDADGVFEAFISAVEQKNSAQLSQLFAGSVSTKDDFSKQMDVLFDYYKGEKQSFSKVAEYASGEQNDGYQFEETMMSYIVSSSTGQYCVAIQYCTKDTSDKNNIGITSVYITEKQDEQQMTYWGNSEWQKGINIT